MKAQSVPGQRQGAQQDEAVPTLPHSANCSTPSLPVEPSLVLGAGLPSRLRVPARPRGSSCLLTRSQHSRGSAVEGHTLHSRVWDLRPHSCPQCRAPSAEGQAAADSATSRPGRPPSPGRVNCQLTWLQAETCEKGGGTRRPVNV